MNIEIINKEAEIAVAITKEAVRFDNMGNLVDEVYGKLMAYLAEQGKEIAGPPYCKYFNGTDDYMQFDMEFGIPVNEPLPEKGDIYMSITYEGKAISAMHKGAYKDIDSTYTPMMEYLAANKLESTGVYYDHYISNPADTPESELLTKVVFPLK